MRFIPLVLVIGLAAAPALAQQTGSLPPPVPRAAEPAQSAPLAAQPRQPGLGERAGTAIDRAAGQTGQALERAAEGTGDAVGRALRWTGQQMQGAGEWTARQGERITGQPGTPAQPGAAAQPGTPPPAPR